MGVVLVYDKRVLRPRGVNGLKKLGNTRELDQHHLPIKILTRCRRRVHHRIRNTKRLRLT